MQPASRLISVATAAATAVVSGWWVPRALAAVPAGSKPRVVATTSIFADWVKVVGGDDVDLTTLVGPDADVHEYQPVPADDVSLGKCDLLVEDGLGLESSWLDKLYLASHAEAVRAVLSKGVDVRHVPESEGERPNGRDDDRDPHAWLNVTDAEIMVDNLRDALVKVDPAHAADYTARTAAYEQGLAALDAYAMAQVHSIPERRRTLFTSHDAFGYLGLRYGLNVPRSALESVTTEASDPSAQKMAEVVSFVKASGVPVIFFDSVQNPRVIDQIASEAHVKVGPPLYDDAMGKPGSDADTYLNDWAQRGHGGLGPQVRRAGPRRQAPAERGCGQREHAAGGGPTHSRSTARKTKSEGGTRPSTGDRRVAITAQCEWGHGASQSSGSTATRDRLPSNATWRIENAMANSPLPARTIEAPAATL